MKSGKRKSEFDRRAAFTWVWKKRGLLSIYLPCFSVRFNDTNYHQSYLHPYDGGKCPYGSEANIAIPVSTRFNWENAHSSERTKFPAFLTVTPLVDYFPAARIDLGPNGDSQKYCTFPSSYFSFIQAPTIQLRSLWFSPRFLKIIIRSSRTRYSFGAAMYLGTPSPSVGKKKRAAG